jgi:hypothetical protein
MSQIKRFIFIIVATMMAASVSGQNLNGKWLLKDVDSGNEKIGYPGFQLLEVKNENAHMFRDFSLLEKWIELKFESDTIFTSNDFKYATFKLVNENHLKLFIDGTSNGKDAIFECDFYRLLPTITTIEKEDIEAMTFLLKSDKGRETELKFNIELIDKEILKSLNKEEGEKRILEKIDSTYFVSFYDYGERRVSLPIKEVTTEFLTLYAIPTGPMEMIAYRKN